MATKLFSSIIQNGEITSAGFFAATLTSLVIGVFIAVIFRLTGKKFSQSFLTTLALLPAMVELVILLVNGNIGAGVAVAGAFSLVRYRSVPGTGQEITGIFLAMACGLATGMGYLGIAALFALIVGVLFLLLSKAGFGKDEESERVLRITIPENLDFDGVFDDLFDKYTSSCELAEVKTANMGSLYKLSYNIILKDGSSLKDLIDDLRIRNGNLEISCGRPVSRGVEL